MTAALRLCIQVAPHIRHRDDTLHDLHDEPPVLLVSRRKLISTAEAWMVRPWSDGRARRRLFARDAVADMFCTRYVISLARTSTT
jgi:hypothetical protein